MRLGILTGIAFSLLAASTAMAQPDEDEAPLPPSPSRPLPSASAEPTPMNSPAMPAWQAPPPGSYGGWYGGDYGYGGGCCSSCDSCCHSCRPGLMMRLKMLKCKLCARWECRRSCRSCCGSSCCGSSCCGSDCLSSHSVGHDVPMAPSHSDLLPVPPTEAAPYDSDEDEDSMEDETPHRAASARTQVKKRHYSMPRVTTAQKTTRSKKSVQR